MIGAKSFTGSYGSFEYRLGAMPCGPMPPTMIV